MKKQKLDLQVNKKTGSVSFGPTKEQQIEFDLKDFKWHCITRKFFDGIFCPCWNFEKTKDNKIMPNLKKGSMCYKIKLIEREYQETLKKLQEKHQQEIWRVQKKIHQKLTDIKAFKENIGDIEK